MSAPERFSTIGADNIYDHPPSSSAVEQAHDVRHSPGGLWGHLLRTRPDRHEVQPMPRFSIPPPMEPPLPSPASTRQRMRSLLDIIHEDRTVTTTVTYPNGTPISEEHAQSLLPPRRRATPGIRFSSRHQDRHSRPPPEDPTSLVENAWSELQAAGQRLAQMNQEADQMSQELNQLLGRTGGVSNVRPRSLDDERDGQPSRKRRRLDRTPEKIYPVPYGYHGQAVPTRLKMQLVSCDGGDLGHENPVENVLRNDNSVFCTRDGSCNMVLSHEGEAMFTLSKLVIRRPGYNFSQPVQQGLVFTSTGNSKAFHNTREHVMQSLSGRSRAFDVAESWVDTHMGDSGSVEDHAGGLQDWYEHHCVETTGDQDFEPQEFVHQLEDSDSDEMPHLVPIDPSSFELPQATESEGDIDEASVPPADVSDRPLGARAHATRRDIDELVRRGLQARADRMRRSQRPTQTESPADAASSSSSTRDPASNTAPASNNSSTTTDNLLAPIAHFRFMRSYYNGSRMVHDPRQRSHRQNIPVLRPEAASLAEDEDDIADEIDVDEPAVVEVDAPTMSRAIPFPPPDSEGDVPRRTAFGDGIKTTRVTTSESHCGCKMTIYFDPPVSARYILLKLWQDGAAAPSASRPRYARGQQPVEVMRPVRTARSNTPPGLPLYATSNIEDVDAPPFHPRVRSGLVRTASVRRRRTFNFEQDHEQPDVHHLARLQSQTQGEGGEDLNIDIERVEAWGLAGRVWLPSVDIL